MEDKLFNVQKGVFLNINDLTDLNIEIFPPTDLKVIDMIYFKFWDELEIDYNVSVNFYDINLNNEPIKELNNVIIDNLYKCHYNILFDVNIQMIKHFNKINIKLKVNYEQNIDEENNEKKTKLLLMKVYYIGR